MILFLVILYIGLIPLEAFSIVEGVSYGRIVFLMMLAASLFKFHYCYRLRLRERPHITILAILTAYCFLSSFWSFNIETTGMGVAKLVQWLMITVIATNVLNTKKRIYLAMAAFCLGSLYIGIRSLDIFQMSVEMDEVSRIAGGVAGEDAMDVGNRNENSFLINYAIVFLLILSDRLPDRKTLRLLCYGLIILFFAIILILGSRGGIVMSLAIVAVLAMTFLSGKSKGTMVLFFGLLIAGVFLIFRQLPEILQERYLGLINDISEENMSGRGLIWRNALTSFADSNYLRMFFGTGWGTFYEYYDSLFGRFVGAHNFYIYVLVTLGFTGMGILGAYLYKLYEYLRGICTRKTLYYYLLLIVPLISMMTSNWDGRKWWFIISVFIYRLYRLGELEKAASQVESKGGSGPLKQENAEMSDAEFWQQMGRMLKSGNKRRWR